MHENEANVEMQNREMRELEFLGEKTNKKNKQTATETLDPAIPEVKKKKSTFGLPSFIFFCIFFHAKASLI